MKLSWNPKRIISTRGAVCAGLLAAMALGACGDDTVKPGSDVPLFDVGQTFPDVSPVDTTVPDTVVADVRQDVAPIDSTPPDLVPDTKPPVIASSTPIDGAAGVALPLVVTLNFDEPLFANTVSTATIKLIGYNNEEIPSTVTLDPNGMTVTLRPVTNNQNYASPYKVRVVGGNPALSDKAGNRIVNDIIVSFTTANYPNVDGYHALASKYAPTIYSAVSGRELPQSQVPTKFNLDEDWDLSDNRAWLRTEATTIIPAVYYNVSETYTHFYIHYMYYFPDVNHTAAALVHSNGTRGLLVTVEKKRGTVVVERPIAAHVYTAAAPNEENFGFVTTESGLDAVDNKSATKTEAELFPEGHFESFITAKDHDHCNRNYGQGGFGVCKENNSGYTGDHFIFKYKGGAPTEFKKDGGAFPATMTQVPGALNALGYVLIPVSSSLWIRRFETGNNKIFQATRFAFDGRNADNGDGLSLTYKFLETVGASFDAFGQPIWAWSWNPAVGIGVGAGFFKNKGSFGLDPAWYFWSRHNPEARPESPLQLWTETNLDGFGTNYCFNLFLSIDKRTLDPKCTAQ